MLIRDFEPRDQDAVLWLNQAGSWSADMLATHRAADAPDLLNIPETYQQTGAFLVGIDNQVVVCMGALAEASADVFEMKRVRVALDHQRRGYGKQLVEALEDWARAHSAKAFILDTTVEQLAAQRLYETCGYERTHESEVIHQGETFHLIHYRKSLA